MLELLIVPSFLVYLFLSEALIYCRLPGKVCHGFALISWSCSSSPLKGQVTRSHESRTYVTWFYCSDFFWTLDEVFDGNNAGDIGHYCGNCYKCFSGEDFASGKCCSLLETINTISLYSSILVGWRFICVRKQRTTAKDNGHVNRITEPNYLSGTKITAVLRMTSSNLRLSSI